MKKKLLIGTLATFATSMVFAHSENSSFLNILRDHLSTRTPAAQIQTAPRGLSRCTGHPDLQAGGIFEQGRIHHMLGTTWHWRLFLRAEGERCAILDYPRFSESPQFLTAEDYETLATASDALAADAMRASTVGAGVTIRSISPGHCSTGSNTVAGNVIFIHPRFAITTASVAAQLPSGQGCVTPDMDATAHYRNRIDVVRVDTTGYTALFPNSGYERNYAVLSLQESSEGVHVGPLQFAGSAADVGQFGSVVSHLTNTEFYSPGIFNTLPNNAPAASLHLRTDLRINNQPPAPPVPSPPPINGGAFLTSSGLIAGVVNNTELYRQAAGAFSPGYDDWRFHGARLGADQYFQFNNWMSHAGAVKTVSIESAQEGQTLDARGFFGTASTPGECDVNWHSSVPNQLGSNLVGNGCHSQLNLGRGTQLLTVSRQDDARWRKTIRVHVIRPAATLSASNSLVIIPINSGAAQVVVDWSLQDIPNAVLTEQIVGYSETVLSTVPGSYSRYLSAPSGNSTYRYRVREGASISGAILSSMIVEVVVAGIESPTGLNFTLQRPCGSRSQEEPEPNISFCDNFSWNPVQDVAYYELQLRATWTSGGMCVCSHCVPQTVYACLVTSDSGYLGIHSGSSTNWSRASFMDPWPSTALHRVRVRACAGNGHCSQWSEAGSQ